MASLALVPAAVIMLGGALEVVSYFRLRRENPSRWTLFSGIATFFLGAMIGFHWPGSSAWAMGTLLGMTLMMTGITRLMFTIMARKFATQPPNSR